MLSVTHVIAGLSSADGGPSYSVPALSEALCALGQSSRVYYVAECGSREISSHRSAVRHHLNMGVFRQFRGSRELREALEKDARSGAIFHAHGLWLLPNMYPAWIKRRLPSLKVIHAPRGMLSREALRFSRWKKIPVWLLWQRRALEAADCLHATATSEYKEIRAAGLRNPVAVIPNGIDLPIRWRDVRSVNPHQRTILSLGRVHPKKGLDVLVHAWSKLEKHYPNWRVRIVGPAEVGYDNELRSLNASLGNRNITIEGPAYGEAKTDAYLGADVFVLPTRNENFGISIAEALAAGVPVITTKGAPWPRLESERCGWWIEHGVDPLANALREAMENDPALMLEMGERGRSWMQRDYSWDRVAREMTEVYRWLATGGEPPRTVSLG